MGYNYGVLITLKKYLDIRSHRQPNIVLLYWCYSKWMNLIQRMLCDSKVCVPTALSLAWVQSNRLVLVVNSLEYDSIMYGIYINYILLHGYHKLLPSRRDHSHLGALPGASHVQLGFLIEDFGNLEKTTFGLLRNA